MSKQRKTYTREFKLETMRLAESSGRPVTQIERELGLSQGTIAHWRRGVHGFRATAACEFVGLKRALGYTEAAARKELAMWLGHNPHRTEVTYAYAPKNRHT